MYVYRVFQWSDCLAVFFVNISMSYQIFRSNISWSYWLIIFTFRIDINKTRPKVVKSVRLFWLLLANFRTQKSCHVQTFDISHALLPLIVAKFSPLKNSPGFLAHPLDLPWRPFIQDALGWRHRWLFLAAVASTQLSSRSISAQEDSSTLTFSPAVLFFNMMTRRITRNWL